MLADTTVGARNAGGTTLRLPRISVVVPTFNGAAYLERCIRSILEQDYPDAECIVMDGGSNDGTRDILKRYNDRLTYWESEKDRGQSHAINKGFARATGDVLNWLGSDDMLLPGAFHEIGRRFAEDPTIDVLVGGCYMRYLQQPTQSGPTWTDPESVRLIPLTNPLNQPSCFFRRRIVREGAVVDESFNYAMDTELWSFFLSNGTRWEFTETVLSEYLWTGDNKTMTGGKKVLRELRQLIGRYRPRSERPMHWAIWRIIHSLDNFKRANNRSLRRSVAERTEDLLWRLLCKLYGSEKILALLRTYHFFDPPQPKAEAR